MSVQEVGSDELLDVLKAARRGQVIVIAAPPASGKSRAMYAAILREIASRGELPLFNVDVLWAVHGIKGDTSLGREAFNKITQLGRAAHYFFTLPTVPADVLWGSEEARHLRIPYARQFTNPGRPPIHITSQALAFIMLTKTKTALYKRFLKTVRCIVIDEDPTEALTYHLAPTPGSSPMSMTALEELHGAGAVGNIETALLRVIQQAQRGEFKLRPISGHVGEPSTYSLTGRTFWGALVKELRGMTPDMRQFTSTLARLAEHAPASLFTAFGEELLQAHGGTNLSHRFGLTWTVDKEGTVSGMEFRADVLVEVPRETPPIIILDGYANTVIRQYETLFPNHDVLYIDHWESSPLEIEYLPNEFNPSRDPAKPHQGIIDRRNLYSGDQRPWLHAWMAEIGQVTQGHVAGTLNLSYKEAAEYLARPDPKLQAAWSRKVTPALPADAMKSLWWFAGRGINGFEGRHVVAWHAPHRPSNYEHHALAALAPTDARRREALKTHYFQAELLQMLHRGRQTRYHREKSGWPRVITLFEPGPLPEKWATLTPYIPTFDFTKWSENPQHAGAVRAVAAELLGLYKGIPHVCLTALGLYTPKKMEAELAERVIRGLIGQLRRASVAKYPILTAWRQAGSSEARARLLQERLGPFVAAHGADTDRVIAILKAGSATGTLVSHNVQLPDMKKGVTTRVYAMSPVEAEAALARLLK